MISEEEQKTILIQYLGPFLSSGIPSEKERKYLSENVKKLEDILFIADGQEPLNRTAIYCLLSFGRKSWRVIDTYEMTSILLGVNEDEVKSFYGWPEEIVFIRYPRATTRNIKNDEVILHTTDWRKQHGKGVTIVLTDMNTAGLAELQKGWQGRIIDLREQADFRRSKTGESASKMILKTDF